MRFYLAAPALSRESAIDWDLVLFVEGLHYFDRNGRYFDRNAILIGTWIAILIGKRERAILIGTCIAILIGSGPRAL